MIKNLRIEVYKNGERVMSKKRPRVAPGEMESILLNGDLLSGADEIRLEVVKL